MNFEPPQKPYPYEKLSQVGHFDSISLDTLRKNIECEKSHLCDYGRHCSCTLAFRSQSGLSCYVVKAEKQEHHDFFPFEIVESPDPAIPDNLIWQIEPNAEQPPMYRIVGVGRRN